MTAHPGGRVRLGNWTCPSGNDVEVFYRMVGDQLASLEMEWDSPPPLTAADETYYLVTIRPAVLMRVREYTEATGRTLVITA
jgi:hypothetical protein